MGFFLSSPRPALQATTLSIITFDDDIPRVRAYRPRDDSPRDKTKKTKIIIDFLSIGYGNRDGDRGRERKADAERRGSHGQRWTFRKYGDVIYARTDGHEYRTPTAVPGNGGLDKSFLLICIRNTRLYGTTVNETCSLTKYCNKLLFH